MLTIGVEPTPVTISYIFPYITLSTCPQCSHCQPIVNLNNPPMGMLVLEMDLILYGVDFLPGEDKNDYCSQGPGEMPSFAG